MGLLDSIRKALAGSAPRSGSSNTSGGDKRWYCIYARCRRCGEPLQARIDLYNDPSEDDEGVWLVRKGLVGNGKDYCFQVVEVTLRFDTKKEKVLEAQATGGDILSADEYRSLVEERNRAAVESPQADATPGQ